MIGPQDQIRINCNQNLWGLVVGLVAMSSAEHYKLGTLFRFSVVVSVLMLGSPAVTTLAYTINDWKNKQG